MADDKLKTGPEPPGPDRPGDAPAKEAPPIQEPPVQETDAPGKTQEPAAPGTGPALQAEQSVIPVSYTHLASRPGFRPRSWRP